VLAAAPTIAIIRVTRRGSPARSTATGSLGCSTILKRGRRPAGRHPPFLYLSLICFVLASIITLLIPLGHVASGSAICLFALGLMQHDGLVVGLGLIAAALALMPLTIASAGVINVVHQWFMS